MNIMILANGPTSELPDLLSYTEDDSYWIGVDRGVYVLLQQGITPKRAFGDFDSLTPAENEWLSHYTLPFSTYPQEKGKTDLEIALDWAIGKQPEKITVFGATGGRMDHMLINVQMLLKGLRAGIIMQLVDKRNIVALCQPGTYRIEKEPSFSYVSFLPFTSEIKGLTLHGFKYPLENKTVQWASSLCISNELVANEGTFSFTDGLLLVIKSKDD